MKLPDIEQLAAAAHAIWLFARRAEGVSSRKSAKGEELMVPYDRLSERAKERYREEGRAWHRAFVPNVEELDLMTP
jgi:hypothetical protein